MCKHAWSCAGLLTHIMHILSYIMLPHTAKSWGAHHTCWDHIVLDDTMGAHRVDGTAANGTATLLHHDLCTVVAACGVLAGQETICEAWGLQRTGQVNTCAPFVVLVHFPSITALCSIAISYLEAHHALPVFHWRWRQGRKLRNAQHLLMLIIQGATVAKHNLSYHSGDD